jgi:phage gp29-like protein
MSDAKVSHAINLRGREFLKRKPYLTAPKRAQDQKLAKRIAEEMQEVYTECVTPEVAELIMFRQPLMSFALFNVTWEENQGLVLPEFRHYHESWTYFLQDSALENRVLQAITMGGGAEDRPESHPIRDSDEDWFLFAPFGKYRGWIRAGVLQVAVPWMVRELSLRDWSRCSEVWGVPVKIIKVPANATEDDKARLFAEANEMGSEVSFILPVANDGSGFTVELLEPKQPKCWEIFSELGARCSSDIALALAGSQHLSQLGDQSAAGKSSSMASSKTSKSEEDDYGEQDAIRFAQAYRSGPLKRTVLYNYEVDDTYVPLFSLSSEEPENKAETCKAWFDLARAMDLWLQMGAETNLDVIIEETGAPLTGKMVAPQLPTAPEDDSLEPKAMGRGSMIVQSVLIDKAVYSLDEAKDWVSDHEFETDVDTKEDTYRFRQHNPEDFADDSFRTITIAKGIHYVIGRLKKDTEGHVAKFERHARGKRHDQGLEYVDKLGKNAASAAVDAMKPHLDNVQAAIASAKTPEELERKLKRLARAVKYGHLEQLVRNSRLMAHGAGRTVEVDDE